MPILEVRGLVKYYGRRKVVDGVGFEVDVGEVVGLLGPNGAGKTTSFRMTTGQITPNEGKVMFNGRDVTELPMYRRARLGMGYLSQETSVFRKLSVEQNILAILEAMPVCRSLGRSLNRRERWERTDEVLTRFGLNKVRKNVAARPPSARTESTARSESRSKRAQCVPSRRAVNRTVAVAANPSPLATVASISYAPSLSALRRPGSARMVSGRSSAR